jgi:hypothetical protein
MQTPVKRILMGHPLEEVIKLDSMRNPHSIQFFLQFRKEKEKQWSHHQN